MKKLTKIRLINWHYIANETIDVKNNILLTGQNASGKSTILDAITYVITAGDTQFNLAANEKGKRDLRGYVKCKLGIEDKEYLRDGDVTGDICLEFFDESLNQYFIVGTVIDAFGDLSPVKTLFYTAENKQIDDKYFVDGNGKIYSTVEFRKNNGDFDYYLTKKEAKRGFRTMFGSINEDFFKMIPKALAFKPIADVKDFIYQNILEEKHIDVSNIQDSIRSYKDLEATLNVIKAKINDLTEIEKMNDTLKEITEHQAYINYLMKLFDEKKIEQEKVDIKDQIALEKSKLDAKISYLNKTENEEAELKEKSRQLYDALSLDDGFKNSEYIQNQIDKTRRELEEVSNAKETYLSHVSSAKDTINDLRKEFNNEVFNKFANLPLNNLDPKMLEDTSYKLNGFIDQFKQVEQDNLLKAGELRSLKDKVVSEMQQVHNAQSSLDSNRLHYPQGLLDLRRDIQEGLKRIFNKDISVHILCELLEIKDRAWSKTIESLLGNQRFTLIVEPKYYDQALSCFARVKSRYNYGFGLVDTDRISRFKDYEENSIASIIETENIDARHYINYTCGNVIMCHDESELKNYSVGITNDGLLYRGYVVRSMNPNPGSFIGSQALGSQKQEFDLKKQELKTKYYELTEQFNKLQGVNEAIDSINISLILKEINNLIKYTELNEKLNSLMIEKSQSKKLSTTETQDEYNMVDQKLKKIGALKLTISQDIGMQRKTVENLEEKLLQKGDQITKIDEMLFNLAQNDPQMDTLARNEFDTLTKDKSIDSAYNECENRFKSEQNNLTNVSDGILLKQNQYIVNYNSNLSVGINELPKFLSELDKLVKSELVKYEKKVRNARETAELIFKEDFISKLRNNIITAEAEISKINETLESIKFGNDSYEFIFPKSQEFGAFYDMFKSDNVSDGRSIFTVDFEQQYNLQLDELFSSIANEDINDSGSLSKLTDYRTYMDYDIRITNEFGQTMLYSKVFKEKSGGETQVPFYVAMLASFVRIYSANNQGTKDSIGLVLFDEVFDKMDKSRMKSMMEFITSMPLQVIIACPPQRMEVLSEYTDTTLVMMRKNNRAQVLPITTKKDYEVLKRENQSLTEGEF